VEYTGRKDIWYSSYRDKCTVIVSDASRQRAARGRLNGKVPFNGFEVASWNTHLHEYAEKKQKQQTWMAVAFVLY